MLWRLGRGIVSAETPVDPAEVVHRGLETIDELVRLFRDLAKVPVRGIDETADEREQRLKRLAKASRLALELYDSLHEIPGGRRHSGVEYYHYRRHVWDLVGALGTAALSVSFFVPALRMVDPCRWTHCTVASQCTPAVIVTVNQCPA